MQKKKIYALPEDVISPHPRAYPRYLISPFNTEYLTANHKIFLKNKHVKVKHDFLNEYFNDAKKFSYLTRRGQECITMILQEIDLKPNDEICILNTSGSPYISSCVTSEIEKVCKWGRAVNKNTKCVFIIHEFGFPAKVPKEILNSDLIIIEDCAYCLGSQNEDKTIGMLGDYAIYSFSKIFPVQYGGMVRSKKRMRSKSALSAYSGKYLLILLQHYFKSHKGIISKRRENYAQYVKLFAKHRITPSFKIEKNNVPSAFVFSMKQTPLSHR